MADGGDDSFGILQFFKQIQYTLNHIPRKKFEYHTIANNNRTFGIDRIHLITALCGVKK